MPTSRSALDKLLRGTPGERLAGWLRRLACRWLGHKKPYIEKFTARLCRRCYIVVEHRSPYLSVLPLQAPWPPEAPADSRSGLPPRRRNPQDS